MSILRTRLQTEMKNAMREKASDRLITIRSILAAVKQYEIDHRSESGEDPVTDPIVVSILERLAKQRRDSIQQFAAGNRMDLVTAEQYQLSVIQEFLPPALTDSELQDWVSEAIQATNIQSPKEISLVMTYLKSKPELQGRLDFSKVPGLIRAVLEKA